MSIASALASAEGRSMVSFFLVQPVAWLLGLFWAKVYSPTCSLGATVQALGTNNWALFFIFGPSWFVLSFLVHKRISGGPKLSRSCARMIKSGGLQGKVALISGCNTGIGLVCAVELAKAGATIIMACRDEKKMLAAREKIIADAKIPAADAADRILTIKLDLNSLSKTQSTVKELQGWYQPAVGKLKHLDYLINNAGLFFPTVSYTGDIPATGTPQGIIGSDIFETNVHVNHLAPVLLTEGLLPILKATAKAGRQVRIINVASGAHAQIQTPEGALNPKQQDPPPHAAYLRRLHTSAPTSVKSLDHNGGLVGGKFQLYGLSKACNIFYAKNLQKRFDRSADVGVRNNMKAVSLHPGFIMTDVFRRLSPVTRSVMNAVLGNSCMKSVSQGANTTLTAALEPWDELKAGAYYVDNAPSPNGVSWGPGDNDSTINWADVSRVMDFTFDAIKTTPTEL